MISPKVDQYRLSLTRMSIHDDQILSQDAVGPLAGTGGSGNWRLDLSGKARDDLWDRIDTTRK